MEEKRLTSMADDSSFTCSNGHTLTATQRFCPVCGSAAQSDAPRTCPNGHAVPRNGTYCTDCGFAIAARETSSRSTSQPDMSSGGGSISPEPKSLIGKHLRIAIAVGIIFAALVSIVLVWSFHSTNESLSWRDGYATGSADVTTGFTDQNGESSKSQAPGDAASDCSYMWSSGGGPAGDNHSQWIAGCEAGDNAAWYKVDHPGAATGQSGSSGSGNSGNTSSTGSTGDTGNTGSTGSTQSTGSTGHSGSSNLPAGDYEVTNGGYQCVYSNQTGPGGTSGAIILIRQLSPAQCIGLPIPSGK